MLTFNLKACPKNHPICVAQVRPLRGGNDICAANICVNICVDICVNICVVHVQVIPLGGGEGNNREGISLWGGEEKDWSSQTLTNEKNITT